MISCLMGYISCEPVNSYHAQSYFYFWWGSRIGPFRRVLESPGCVGFLCLSQGSVGLRIGRQTVPILVYYSQKVKD